MPATRDNGKHAARHYYASALLEDGVSIRLASLLADPRIRGPPRVPLNT